MNITIIKGITGITIYHWLINHQKIAIMRDGRSVGWIAFSCLKKVVEFDWVYGRYNGLTSFHGCFGCFHGVYKPTGRTILYDMKWKTYAG